MAKRKFRLYRVELVTTDCVTVVATSPKDAAKIAKYSARRINAVIWSSTYEKRDLGRPEVKKIKKIK